MSDDVETVGCEGHEHGERRAAVECGEHLLAVTDALLLMRQQHKSVPSMARDEDQGEERGEERRGVKRKRKRKRWGQFDQKRARFIACFQKCLSAALLYHPPVRKPPATLLASNGF